MRYNPDTDKAVDIDVIAEQCHKAITVPAPVVTTQPRWGELAAGCWRRWRDYGAGDEICSSRSSTERMEIYHHATVVEAFGDRRRARSIRFRLVDLTNP